MSTVQSGEIRLTTCNEYVASSQTEYILRFQCDMIRAAAAVVQELFPLKLVDFGGNVTSSHVYRGRDSTSTSL